MSSWKNLIAMIGELPEEAQKKIKREVEDLIAIHTPPPTREEMLGLIPCPSCKKGDHEKCEPMYTAPFDGKPICCMCAECSDYAKRILKEGGQRG